MISLAERILICTFITDWYALTAMNSGGRLKDELSERNRLSKKVLDALSEQMKDGDEDGDC